MTISHSRGDPSGGGRARFRRPGRLLAIATAAIALTAGALASCRSRLESPAPAPFREVTFGLCQDYPEETRSLEQVRGDLAVVRAAGARRLRVSIGWDDIEPEPGRRDWTFWDGFFDEAERAGVAPIPYVCYTPEWNAPDPEDRPWASPPRDVAAFEALMRDLASRYRGRTASWEIWNEPDNRDYWTGTVAQFAALLRAGASGVRAGDPAAAVVGGGLAGDLSFLEKLVGEAGVGRAFDVLNLHAYFETWNPDPWERLPDYVRRAEEILKGSVGAKPIWMAELGYSSFRRGGVVSPYYKSRFDYEHTLRHQAVTLARAVALALSTGQVPMFAWYQVRDVPPGQPVIGDDNNRWLGIVASDGRRKRSFRAFRFVAGLFSEPVRPIDDETRIVRRIGSDAETHVFERRDGVIFAFGWLRTRVFGQAPGPEPVPDLRRETVDLMLPDRAGMALTTFDETGEKIAAGRIVKPLGEAPSLRGLELRGGRVVVAVIGK